MVKEGLLNLSRIPNKDSNIAGLVERGKGNSFIYEQLPKSVAELATVFNKTENQPLTALQPLQLLTGQRGRRGRNARLGRSNSMRGT